MGRDRKNTRCRTITDGRLSLGNVHKTRKDSLPFVGLTREGWERLGNAGALLALALVVLFASIAVYLHYGHDFRGYYAAARVALAGGDPYDYRQVAPVLLQSTGYAGNNPFYYPPWVCLALLPLALLSFDLARAVWIGVNWALFFGGLALTFKALDWPIRGWRRWLVSLSALYLFTWVTLRFEQLGTFMFFCLAWALWALGRDPSAPDHGPPDQGPAGAGPRAGRTLWISSQRSRDVQAGLAMALLLTKPNVMLLAVVYLLISSRRSRNRALLWALIWLGVLAGVGTLLYPGWLAGLLQPNFGLGLTQLLDGPDRVLQPRRLCTLLHWLEAWGITGTTAWILYGALAVAGLTLAWRSPRLRSDRVYGASLGAVLTLLLTPYALLYDYTPLIVGQLWAFQCLGQGVAGTRRWLSIAILIFMFSVLLWVGPEVDGYWLALGMWALLLLLGAGRVESRRRQGPPAEHKKSVDLG